MSLTAKDLDDIKKIVEDGDPNVKIDWIFNDSKKDDGMGGFSFDNIHIEEIIHYDSGHNYEKPETWGNKWHYGVILVKNTHPKITLLNAEMEFVYDWSPWEMNPPGMSFEAPPKKRQATEYTIKKKRSFIERFFTSKEAFDKFHYQKDARQEFDPEEKNKNRVKYERFRLGDIKPNAERYIIFRARGWSNRVRVKGDIPGPKETTIRKVQAEE